MTFPDSPVFQPTAHGIALRVKVVPGASRTRIAGWLGDRLKIQIAAPADSGQANRALCQFLARTFNLAPRAVRIVSGLSQPQKTVELEGLSSQRFQQILASLNLPLPPR